MDISNGKRWEGKSRQLKGKIEQKSKSKPYFSEVGTARFLCDVLVKYKIEVIKGVSWFDMFSIDRLHFVIFICIKEDYINGNNDGIIGTANLVVSDDKSNTDKNTHLESIRRKNT